jgi:hypothetical protein
MRYLLGVRVTPFWVAFVRVDLQATIERGAALGCDVAH